MKKSIFLVCAALLILSCTQSTETEISDPIPIPNPDPQGFLFKLTVTDTEGKPVPGLSVSIRPKLSIDMPGGSLSSGSTGVRFFVPAQCRAKVTAIDLTNQPVSILLDRIVEPGNHVLQWNVPAERRSVEVFKIRLAAYDPLTGFLFYTDSIYAARYGSDAVEAGRTSANGAFETNNSLLFPNLFGLPVMVQTGTRVPTAVGRFTFSDAIEIVLSNQNGQNQSYSIVVTSERSEHHLMWNPSPAMSKALDTRGTTAAPTAAGDNSVVAENQFYSRGAVSSTPVFSTITFRNSRGNAQTLYFSPPDTIDPGFYELPPPGPDSFDVRYDQNRMLVLGDTLEAKSARVHVLASFPLRVSWNNNAHPFLRAFLETDGNRHALQGIDSVTIDQPQSLLRLVLEPVPFSRTFRLWQNYPNPFN